MKRLMFLTLLVTCLAFVYTGCDAPEPVGPPDDTQMDSGNEDNGRGDENSNPDIPEGFEEEPDDPASDQIQTFDYSKLSAACHPYLLIDSDGFKELKKKVTTDKRSNKTLYKLHTEIIAHAKAIFENNVQFTSADNHYIIVENLLYCAYAYKMTGQSAYLAKARSDLMKVSRFSTWNPDGLSVGEISLAVALAYDWLYYDLTLDERKTIRKAMVNRGVKQMLNRSYANTIGNWNQVCLGGVLCASLASYEKEKDICRRQIEKAVSENLKGVKGIYSPHGNYGEGHGYWEYGTSYQVCMLSCLEGVFGNTAGIKEVPGFMQSGKYALFMHGTANSTFSYSDGGGSSDSPFISSWWFAAENDDPSLIYAEKRMLDNGAYSNIPLESSEKPFRLLPAVLCMVRDYEFDKKSITPPVEQMWKGDGEMPVLIVRKGWNYDESDVYLGIKAGQCNSWATSATSHAHMDMGSFVFEAEGVRWSDDIQRPGYTNWFNALSKAGSRSGDTSQRGLRWDTFHVSNLCHSTIVSYTNDGSVSGKLHSSDYFVDGFATIDEVINTASRKGGVVNMTSPMKGQVANAKRTIEIVNGTDLVVTDEITALPNLDCKLEWRMLSLSSSSVESSGVVLTQDGKTRILSATSSDPSVALHYTVWPTTKPLSDGWGVLDFHQNISNRTIAGWTATVPKGSKVNFITILTIAR